MQCSVCTLPAVQACGNLCGVIYCGEKCAQADWQNRHGLLCIAGQTKREREEPTTVPSVDELIITIKTLRLVNADANKELLESLEIQLIKLMNSENGPAVIAILNAKYSNERLLRITATYGNVQGAQYLLSIGTNVNAQNANKYSALLIAVTETRTTSNESMVALLLKQPNIDVNIKDDEDFTPLMLASQFTATDSTENTVRMLLQHPKINVNAQESTNGRTALMIAIHNAQEQSTTKNTVLMLTRHPDTDFFIRRNNGLIASDIAKSADLKLMIFSAIAMQKFMDPTGTRMMFPRDISTNLSLRRLRNHVCASLSDNGNVEDLKAFAQLLKFPYIEGVNKRDLCLALSDVLALGNVYDHDKQQQYAERKQMRIQQTRKALSAVDAFKRAAEEYVGIDTTGKTLDQIVQEVNVLLS